MADLFYFIFTDLQVAFAASAGFGLACPVIKKQKYQGCIHQVVAIVTRHYGNNLPLVELSAKWLSQLGMELGYRLELSELRTEI